MLQRLVFNEKISIIANIAPGKDPMLQSLN